MRPQPTPRPVMDDIMLCPVCRQAMRRTAELCPHCGAERRFGPTPRETARGLAGGAVAVPLFAIVVAGPSLWDLPMALAGAMAGFFFAHSRHGGDRWIGGTQRLRVATTER
ncbi:hypothetical protein [Acidomonas methanolica]|uniref:hypothetical protein n=1 Tax=Acidomonas methanolica TaxID=437 RepID=UPI002119EFF3|nr:hypothetical protein [Acidomonas methanolica]